MGTVTTHHKSPLISWGLLVGGAFFLAGGPLHPKEDPPDVTVKEHLRLMFEDTNWYLSHAILLVGMVLIAASLVALVRGRSLAGVAKVHRASVIAAVAASVAAPVMLLHLISAIDAARIAAHQATPTTDIQNITETIAVPAFGFAIAYLAVIGARTRALGNLVISVPGVLGGIGYGLASATFLFTDRLDFLFPAAAGIALWSILVGSQLLLRWHRAGQ
jgi:hypothetical protein